MRERQRSLPGFEEPLADGDRRAVGTPHASPGLANRTVYIVDAHGLIYQVFHALPEMTSPSGQPVGAVHGFIRDVLELIETKQPDYFFCAFDSPGKATFRHELYQDYKAHRESMPEDLKPQVSNIRRLLAALGVPTLICQGYEADDILATVVRQTEAHGAQCVVVTNDKDCRQLISDRVRLYNVRKDQFFDAGALWQDWGVRPDQVVDFQALVGDSVDNIPGVPLIGPKLARELLQKYETLEGVLDHAGEVPGRKRSENLVQYRQQALLSRKLVRLDPQVPVDIDWQAGQVGGIDLERSGELCKEFGFRRLAEQLSQASLPPAAVASASNYRSLITAEELAAAAAQMQQQTRLAIELLATSPQARWAEITGCAVAWSGAEACYIPLQAGAQLEPSRVLDLLRPVLENAAIEKVGSNLKFSLVCLRASGINLAGVCCDTMVADYLLDAGQRNHDLADLARRYLNCVLPKLQDLTGTGKKRKSPSELALPEAARFAAERADVALRLAGMLQEKLTADGLSDLFREMEMPLVEVLAELEFNGITLDAARLRQLGDRFGARIMELQQQIFTAAGNEFNIDSRVQLAQLLFDQLGLPVIKRTKTGPSTDADVLHELAGLHPLPDTILQYRHYTKLKSTYAEALADLVHPRTHRVHTSFKQDVAATGRLSSTDPNLQNIPIRTAEGREIRSAFVPPHPDWLLLAADYSQIELRVLAHCSRDPVLQSAFAADRDIHALVASQVHGVPLAEVTSQMRRSAKAVNFGVIYGQSAYGLSKALGISQDDAVLFINAYFAQYVGVKNFIKKVLEDCRRNGYVTTIFGRRRAIQGIRDPSLTGTSRQRNLPERIAINTVIQGSAADLIKRAMVNVSRRLQREQLRSKMLLQIHDELVFEVPSDELTDLSTLVTEEMTAAGQLDVPLSVDVKTGATWADC